MHYKMIVDMIIRHNRSKSIQILNQLAKNLFISPLNQRDSHVAGKDQVGVAEKQTEDEWFPVFFAHTAVFAFSQICGCDEWVKFKPRMHKCILKSPCSRRL